jgi:CDP-diacylglycerol--serine O-phosphatidyltransferase
MDFKKFIPNFLTLLNLLSGTIAIIFAMQGQLVIAAYLVFLGIFFDFFDGFFARLLNVQGELGKQLDSLADVVTSGVVPGLVLYQLLKTNQSVTFFNTTIVSWQTNSVEFIPFIALIIPLAAAYRLAKFNIDERQTDSFIGLPTPASTLVVLSLPLIIHYSTFDAVVNLIQNKWFLVVLALILSYLMNAEIPLFSLKFKNFSWKNNQLKFVFLVITLLLVVVFQFVAIPLVILVYILLSVFFKTKK